MKHHDTMSKNMKLHVAGHDAIRKPPTLIEAYNGLFPFYLMHQLLMTFCRSLSRNHNSKQHLSGTRIMSSH